MTGNPSSMSGNAAWRSHRTGRSPFVVAAALVAVVATHNLLQNLVLPNWTYAAVNVVAAVAALAVGRWLGLSAADLGIEPSEVRRGFLIGAVVAGMAVVAIGAVALVPAARPFFEDARVLDVAPIGAGYEMVIRIPLGTALFEEVLFRGLLLGWLLSVTTMGRAVAASSVLFGLWHILPTLAALDLYRSGAVADAGGLGVALAVAAAVGLTAAFGAVMCGLRIGARSLAAPVIVHAVVNSFVYGVVYFLAAAA